jgi:penicillin-insensitive murein endopeptidase
MLGFGDRTGWRKHALSASLVAVGTLVVGHATWSLASVEPPRPAPVPAPAAPVVTPLGVVPGPSRVELEPLDIKPTPSPLRGLTGVELDRLARTKPASLGTVCVGRPNRGRLFNAVELVSEPGLRVMVRENTWGSAETVRSLRAAVSELRAEYPTAPDATIGDISRRQGGYLRPHRSHQLGLDVDIGYFYAAGGKWYAKANAANLDRELTWAFVKALIAQGNVEYLFMDRGVQLLLRKHALEQGEDSAWLDELFESPQNRDALIRHTWGHATHFHVRFTDPAAQQLGRELEQHLNPRRRRGR